MKNRSAVCRHLCEPGEVYERTGRFKRGQTVDDDDDDCALVGVLKRVEFKKLR